MVTTVELFIVRLSRIHWKPVASSCNTVNRRFCIDSDIKFLRYPNRQLENSTEKDSNDQQSSRIRSEMDDNAIRQSSFNSRSHCEQSDYPIIRRLRDWLIV